MLFSRHLPWPSLPAPSRRRQPWKQTTPPCGPPALLIHLWMPERMLAARVRAADRQRRHFVRRRRKRLDTLDTPERAERGLCFYVYFCDLLTGLNCLLEPPISLSAHFSDFIMPSLDRFVSCGPKYVTGSSDTHSFSKSLI